MNELFQRDLYREVRASLEAGARDMPPLPPRLISQVVGAGGTREGFLYGGFTTALGLRAALRLLGKPLPTFERVLDFGCGPARVLRWLGDLRSTAIYAADVNDEAVAWCRSSDVQATLIHNGSFPPLPIENDTFDLLFAVSVLTHLDELHQLAWVQELRRVIRPDGFLLVTVHGRNKARRELERSEYARYAHRGFFFWSPRERTTLDGLPDFYQVAFHSREYVERTWSRFFEVVLYVSHGPMYEQELIVLRKTRRTRCEPAADYRLPIAVLDAPAPGSTAHPERLRVSGWAFFHERRGPLTVNIWVDGRYAGRCTTNEPRPDVRAAFRSRHADRCGFSMRVPFAIGEGAQHTVWLTIGDSPLPLAGTFFSVT